MVDKGDTSRAAVEQTEAGAPNGSLKSQAPVQAAPQPEAVKGASVSAEDSDATARSTSEDTSQPSRYGLRPKRSRPAKDGSPEETAADSKEGRAEEETGGSKRRKRSSKQGEGSKQDGLLRLAQIAHANPRLPRTQRGDKVLETEAGRPAAANVADQAAAAAEPGAASSAAETQVAAAPVQEAAQQEQATAETATPGAPALQYEPKLTPTQMRALAAAGQLNVPGYMPVPCPYVQAGARWQLDLRTGERVEDQSAAQMGVPLTHMVPGLQNGSGAASFPMAAMGGRPPIFTAPGAQGGHMAPPGGYGIIPPATNYAGSLPISSLGQQALTQGLPTAAGPYTALLGSQMQPLLPPGVLPHGQFPQGFAGMPHSTPPQMGATAPKKRQRSSHAAELADLPEIPLRRRGRPAGDGGAAAASPQELQERRMQANRAAASRSHFRRKREMEVMEKECAVMEARMLDLRNAVANLMAQEENLRLQQAGIREHLALGCKPAGEGGAAGPRPEQLQAANPQQEHEQAAQPEGEAPAEPLAKRAEGLKAEGAED